MDEFEHTEPETDYERYGDIEPNWDAVKEYWRAYPRVTSILDIRNKPELTAWMMAVGPEMVVAKQNEAKAKGNAIHDAIEKFIKGEPYEVNKVYQQYFEGFERWWDKESPSDCATELRLHSDLHEYQGRTDLVCTIGDSRWIIDFKTSKKMDPQMGLQLVAYKTAYQEMTGEHDLRMGIVQLTDQIKRGYRFKEYDEDFGVFMAHKTIYDWVESHKPVRKESPKWELTTLQKQEAS